jgi:transposase-like protein
MSGESLEAVSRDLGVTVAQLSEWRDDALASAEAGLKPNFYSLSGCETALR